MPARDDSTPRSFRELGLGPLGWGYFFSRWTGRLLVEPISAGFIKALAHALHKVTSLPLRQTRNNKRVEAA